MSIMTLSFDSPPLNIMKTNYAGGFVAAVAIFTMLYRKRSLAVSSKNGIPLPPGPPARWFWSNALPAVK